MSIDGDIDWGDEGHDDDDTEDRGFDEQEIG